VTTRTYRALLVANSTFPGDPHNLPELEGPRNDPALLRDALCDREAGLVPSDNVRLVTERTMAEVLREMEDFLRSGTRNDTLILYYSGHGLLDQSNELFLCTRDTRTDRLRSTAIKASDIRQMIDESAAATTVILLDCCHSGRFKGGDVPAALAGRGRFVVTSSRSGELANDTDVRNHASLFTHHLVQGMLHGAEDRDADGVVNLSELYDYVHQALAAHGRQVPQKRFEGDGDVPMALRTATTTAHPRPELLDPVLVAPLLDVPTTQIDLGEVDADVALPPERIAVVNRGGGTLDWTYESSAPWVVAEREGSDLVLHLSPGLGPNRANVYIREHLTGALKTVRVSVRVRSVPAEATGRTVAVPHAEPPAPPLPAPPATAPASVADPASSNLPRSERVEVRPAPPPVGATLLPAPADALSDHEPTGTMDSPPSRDHRAATGRWLAVGAAIVSVLAGALIVISSLDASDAIWDWTGEYRLILREEDIAGLLSEILVGGLLVLAGVLALRRQPNLGLGMAMACALPLGIDRLGAHTQAMSDEGCQCLGADAVFAFRGAALLCLLATVVCASALAVRGEWRRDSWIPRGLLAAALGLTLAWGLVGTTDLYRSYGEPYGSYTGGASTVWLALVTLATTAGVAAASRLERRAALGALTGAVAMPVAAAFSEVLYTLDQTGDEGYSAGWIWPLLLTATLLVAVVVLIARHDRTGPAGASVRSPAAAAISSDPSASEPPTAEGGRDSGGHAEGDVGEGDR
jgi:hypothetical protein